MNYNDLFKTDRPLKVKLNEFELNLKYDSTQFTKENSIITADENTLLIDYYAKTLCKLIKEWDLDRDGQPIPINEDVLIKLDMAFLEYVYRQIEQDNINFIKK